MGVKNYLIDGVSCAGKTTVCRELQRRSYHAIHGVSICARDRFSPALLVIMPANCSYAIIWAAVYSSAPSVVDVGS